MVIEDGLFEPLHLLMNEGLCCNDGSRKGDTKFVPIRSNIQVGLVVSRNGITLW